jgi:hypothetical protein
MRVGRVVALVLAATALSMPSCGTHDASVHRESDQSSLVESPEAARRIGEIRARFRLAGPAPDARFGRAASRASAEPDQRPRPVLAAGIATTFERATDRGATHVHARFPARALAGVSRPARVALPRGAGGVVEIVDETSQLGVGFVLAHVQNAPIELASGIALYRAAVAGADVLHRVRAEGTEDYVVFETRPAREELLYAVDVSRVAGLRLVENTLEFLDAGGAPRLRIAPPWVVDEHGGRSLAKLAIVGCAYDASPTSPLRRVVTPAGAATCTVRITWSGVAYPAMVDPAWTTTGSLAFGRDGTTASLLASGQVLVAAGEIDGLPYSTAESELYDPSSGTFSVTGSMARPRRYHMAVVLLSGKVLVVGGETDTQPAADLTAELYDPSLGTFSSTGSMASDRTFGDATATLLPSGKVLVAGGTSGAGVAGTELYDPSSGMFSPTGPLVTPRTNHTATLLGSGKVLIAGGSAAVSVFDSAELYDPASGTFSATGAMKGARGGHTASLLSTGKVLVAGGSYGTTLRTAEIYDPGSASFSVTGSMVDPRNSHTASVLPTGEVVVVAGLGAGILASTELFDPKAGVFSVLPPLAKARLDHAASTLLSGKVLVVGGFDAAQDPSYPVEAELLAGAFGDPCAKNSYCRSGFCVDGRCCDSLCDKSCDRCDLPGKEGTCRVVAQGEPPQNPVCDYLCDGVGAACPTSCASDTSCAPSRYCAADGTCQPRKTGGSACDKFLNCKEPGCRECAAPDGNGNGYCADGVCCDRECKGCEACKAALKQSGADGVCGPARDGTNPHDTCVRSSVICKEDGQCDGTGGCRLYARAGARCDQGKVCDGSGACVRPPVATCDAKWTVTLADGTPQDCTPYRCQIDGTCRTTCTSVADCVPPSVCDVNQKCSPPPNDSQGGCRAAPPARGSLPGIPTYLVVALALALLRRRTAR